jgi:hypothetical protein
VFKKATWTPRNRNLFDIVDRLGDRALVPLEMEIETAETSADLAFLARARDRLPAAHPLHRVGDRHGDHRHGHGHDSGAVMSAGLSLALGSRTTAGSWHYCPRRTGSSKPCTGTEESVWSYGVEIERVQVCRYRASRCRELSRPALRRSATGRGFEWNLESPPLVLAFTSLSL